MKKVLFGTQRAIIEEDYIYTEIDEPFWTAGKQLNWGKTVPGLGINKQIIAIVLTNKLDLIVSVGKEKKEYKIGYKTILDFIQNNNCDYTVRNDNTLKVINWKLFKRIKKE